MCSPANATRSSALHSNCNLRRARRADRPKIPQHLLPKGTADRGDRPAQPFRRRAPSRRVRQPGVRLVQLHGIARPLQLIGRDQAGYPSAQNADPDRRIVCVAAPGRQHERSRWRRSCGRKQAQRLHRPIDGAVPLDPAQSLEKLPPRCHCPAPARPSLGSSIRWRNDRGAQLQ